jgi:hypothetical protein
VNQFCNECFQEVMVGLSMELKEEFVFAMTLILNCHQYSSEKGLIENVDYSIVRDTMYKYSKKSE